MISLDNNTKGGINIAESLSTIPQYTQYTQYTVQCYKKDKKMPLTFFYAILNIAGINLYN